jgi:hypothetical protein
MTVPTEIHVAECLKRMANNDTDTKSNNTGTYEHAFSLTDSLMFPLSYKKFSIIIFFMNKQSGRVCEYSAENWCDVRTQ